MDDRLRLLLELQEIDREVLSIKASLSRLPDEAKRRTAALQEKKDKLAKSEHTHRTLLLDSKELEGEVNALNSQIMRSQEKMFELRNQREYQAMKSQIASLKADLKHNEDLTLDIMQQVETIKTSVEKLREEIVEEERAIASLVAQADQDKDAAKGRMLELKDERDKLLRRVEPSDYDIYRRLMRPPDFVAVSTVTEFNLCSACNVQIEHQTLNRLYIGREMVFCSNCARILFLKDRS
jgi:predicted  nucleic acid-binding Zn-ribbon protein